MRRVRRQHTTPELQVRRLLHKLGFRYRLHAKELPGSPDIVFRRKRAAVFVHGCYWHGHDCPRGRPSRSNTEFWSAKLSRNRIRDEAAVRSLEEEGWRVLTVWECETRSSEQLQALLTEFLGHPGSAA